MDWTGVGTWLRTNYVLSQEDGNRRRLSKERHELYTSGGDARMSRFIDSVFKDPEVKARRQEWVSRAKFNNISRRIVNELATVYSTPALRFVDGDANNEKYQEFQRVSRLHDCARKFNRWGQLHRSLAVGFRVRTETTGEKKPIIDIVSPDSFFAVAHPTDLSKMIALGFKLASTVGGRAWQVWTDVETFALDQDGNVLTETLREHEYKRMPWLLLSMEPPCGKLIDDSTGKDIDAAHEAAWFMDILHLKEGKSATKQPVIAGDVTTMARNQSSDSEMPIEASDGTTVSAIDFSMDLSMFQQSAQYIYETVAGNYGISPGLLKHQGVQSAEARELMRAPLKELRREQQIYFREFERELAEVQSMVLVRELPDLAFTLEGWGIDFGESRTALDPKAELEVFEHARRLGLTDTIAEIQRRNPDLTLRQAFAELEKHITAETYRNELQRPMLSISGSAGAALVGSTEADAGPSSGATNGDADQRASSGDT
jgi:hypothetical protein